MSCALLSLTSSRSKPYPEHAARDEIAAKLIREIRNIAQIELWTHKHVLSQKDLDARSSVKLEMV